MRFWLLVSLHMAFSESPHQGHQPAFFRFPFAVVNAGGQLISQVFRDRASRSGPSYGFDRVSGRQDATERAGARDCVHPE